MNNQPLVGLQEPIASPFALAREILEQNETIIYCNVSDRTVRWDTRLSEFERSSWTRALSEFDVLLLRGGVAAATDSVLGAVQREFKNDPDGYVEWGKAKLDAKRSNK